MKHFDLYVSNPHVILDQDNGKDFFTHYQPKFLYHYLEKIDQENLELITRAARNFFIDILRDNGLYGELNFCVKERMIEVKKIEVDDSTIPQYLYNRTTATRVSIADISDLERCKFLMCFVMSIWPFQRSPFIVIDDDWNIFLDEHGRKEIAQILLQRAKRDYRQFFFVFPQDVLTNNPAMAKYAGNKISIKDIKEENFNKPDHEFDDNCSVPRIISQIANSNAEEQITNQCQPSTSSTLFEPLPSTSSHDIEHVLTRSISPLPVELRSPTQGPILQRANSNLEQQTTDQGQTSSSTTSIETVVASTSSQNFEKIYENIEQMKNLAETLDLDQLKKLLKANSEKNETDNTTLDEIKALKETIEIQTSRLKTQEEVIRCHEELRHMNEEQIHELVKENSKLTDQCNDQKISLEKKSQEENNSLKETLDEKDGKLKIQRDKTGNFEKQISILMNEFLPNDGTEKTFLKLREEIEYLKRTHGNQKEQIEILQTQLANCQCLHDEH